MTTSGVTALSLPDFCPNHCQRDEDNYLFELLKWVSAAFRNVDGYSSEIRPVMMATAFEILFQFPEEQGKEDKFAFQLEALLGADRMQIYDEKYQPLPNGLPRKKDKNSRSKEKENTMYGWWARDFYSLRSKIVHEGVITNSDWLNRNHKPHLEIALKMMNFCLYRKMENEGYLVYEETPGFPGFSWMRYSVERRLRESVEDLIKF